LVRWRRCGIPTIRFVLRDSVRTVEADRVMADSQVVVAERRHDGAWSRVATVPRGSVLRIERRVPHGSGDQWLTEDVRTAAGLETPEHGAPEPSPHHKQVRQRRWRPSPTPTQGASR
jgi:hypothetical protein